MTDPVDVAQSTEHAMREEALRNPTRTFYPIADCTKCGGPNDRRNYAVCSACMPETRK